MQEQYLDLLAELVNIDSGTGDDEGIAKIAKLLRERFERLQFDFQSLKAGDGSEHFLAERGAGDRVLLIAHLDTVFPKGTARSRPFKVEGETAYGPGVSDCKSGVVTIVGAMERLVSRGWPSCKVGCFFNTDEEISSPGSREIIERLAREAIAVMVVEPAEGNNVTVARKGIGRFEVRVSGKAAHSGSNYQDGANAILELAHKIIAIQNVTDLATGVTLNVGVVNGGVRPNIVPDYAAAEVDLRIVTPDQEAGVIEKLQHIAGSCLVPGTTGRLTGKITRPPMPLTANNLRLYELAKRAGEEIGMELGTFQSGGGSDANFTAALGIATIDGVGPEGGGHHSEEEHLAIPSLFQRIKLLEKILEILPSF
jgi:glutamate carboxypeptidase